MSFFKKIERKVKKYCYGSGYHLMKYRDINMLLRAGNFIDRSIMGGGKYEADQIDKVIKLVNDNNVDYFVDVGANIGIYSLVVARECKRVEKVVSIEAQIENYNQLCANIRLNDCDRIIVAKNIGASDKVGVVDFLINKGSSTGTSRISETSPKDTKLRKFNVDSIMVDKIDNILGEINDKVLFFKIDVEGHELNVLRGMPKTLQNNYCYFQIEVLDNDFSQISKKFNLEKVDSVGCDYYFKSIR